MENLRLLGYLASGAVVITAGIKLYYVLGKKQEKSVPKDTAVIHQLPRGPNAPSMSPFPVKLETFCRMAQIPYVVSSKKGSSSRGKIPWMQYNGQVVEDSLFCIEFFNKKLGLDLNQHLNDIQKSKSKFIQVLVDEHLYWCLMYFRWIHDKDYFPQIVKSHFKMPFFVFAIFQRKLRNQLWGQGIGRHNPEQVLKILNDDLKALSDYLGPEKFMFGDEMCEADCSVFGMLSQLVWHQEDKVLKNILQDKYPNLHQYCLRIKEELWPDWGDCCRGGPKLDQL